MAGPAPAKRRGDTVGKRNTTSARVVALVVDHDDAAIVAGLRDGERWAEAALYDRYARRVACVLSRLIGHDPRLEVEDLLQEAFVRILDGIDSLDDADKLTGWVRTIAARTGYRAIRRQRVRRMVRFWEPTDLDELGRDDSDDGPEQQQTYRRTYEILARMPAAERTVLTLRYVEEMSLGEVAETLEMSLATVKRRIRRAKSRFETLAAHDPVMQQWLADQGREEGGDG